MKNKILVCLYVIMLVAVVGCDTRKPTNTSTKGLATVVCDETFQNIMNQEIGVFEYTYPEANIIPFYTDEKSAIDSLLKMKTKLIVTAHKLTEKQELYLKERKGFCRTQRVAVDAIALIVNPKNPCSILSMKELTEIMSGEVQRWDQLEPSKLDTIDIIFDNEGSSTVQYVRDSILKGKQFPKNVYAQQSNKDVFEVVKKNKNALGVIGVSWISADMKTKDMSLEERVANLNEENVTTTVFADSVKVMKVRRDDNIEAFQPYQAYIFDGSYPLYRNIYMINTAAGGSLSHGFYSFVTGFIGQKIIQQTGILPSVVRPRMVSLN